MAEPIARRVLYLFAALLASQLVLTVTSIWVSSYNAEKASQQVQHKAELANQQWCSTLQIFRDSYRQAPPTTEAGKLLRDRLNGIYEAYHCDGVVKH